MKKTPNVITVKAYMGKSSASRMPALAERNAMTAVATSRGIIGEMSTRSQHGYLRGVGITQDRTEDNVQAH